MSLTLMRSVFGVARGSSQLKFITGNSLYNRAISFRSMSSGVPKAHLEAKLKEKLAATHVELTDLSDGCGQKFAAIIVSPQFAGKNLLAQQRLVNAAIADELQEIHAFTQKTYTPEAWEKANQ